MRQPGNFRQMQYHHRQSHEPSAVTACILSNTPTYSHKRKIRLYASLALVILVTFAAALSSLRLLSQARAQLQRLNDVGARVAVSSRSHASDSESPEDQQQDEEDLVEGSQVSGGDHDVGSASMAKQQRYEALTFLLHGNINAREKLERNNISDKKMEGVLDTGAGGRESGESTQERVNLATCSIEASSYFPSYDDIIRNVSSLQKNQQEGAPMKTVAQGRDRVVAASSSLVSHDQNSSNGNNPCAALAVPFDSMDYAACVEWMYTTFIVKYVIPYRNRQGQNVTSSSRRMGHDTKKQHERYRKGQKTYQFEAALRFLPPQFEARTLKFEFTFDSGKSLRAILKVPQALFPREPYSEWVTSRMDALWGIHRIPPTVLVPVPAGALHAVARRDTTKKAAKIQTHFGQTMKGYEGWLEQDVFKAFNVPIPSSTAADDSSPAQYTDAVSSASFPVLQRDIVDSRRHKNPRVIRLSSSAAPKTERYADEYFILCSLQLLIPGVSPLLKHKHLKMPYSQAEPGWHRWFNPVWRRTQRVLYHNQHPSSRSPAIEADDEDEGDIVSHHQGSHKGNNNNNNNNHHCC